MGGLTMDVPNGFRCKAYLMCGLPGSGKSTWIKEHLGAAPVVSRDIIRSELGYTACADEKKMLTFEQEKEVTAAEYAMIAKHCSGGGEFVIDDTNVKMKYRRQMISRLREFGAYIIGVNVRASLEACVARRSGQILQDAMERVYRSTNYIKPEEVDELIEVEGE